MEKSKTELQILDLTSSDTSGLSFLSSTSTSTVENETFLKDILDFLSSEFGIKNVATIKSISKGIHKFMRKFSEKIKEEAKSENPENSYLKNQIRIYQNENIEMRSQLFEILQKNKEIHRKISEDNVSNQLLIKRNEVLELESRLKESENEIQSKRKKIKTLKIEIEKMKEETTQISIKNEQLQMSIEKLQIEKEELLKQTSEQKNSSLKSQISSKDQEISILTKAFNEITPQFDEINQDLAKESEIKNAVVTIINKQMKAMEKLEEEIQKRDSLIKEQKSKIKSLQEENSNKVNPSEECQHTEVIEVLREYIKEKYAENSLLPNIKEILSSKESVQEKINETVSYLIESNDKPEENNEEIEELKEKNKRMAIYITNIVRFVDQLSSSKEIQEWILCDQNNKSMINIMKQQVMKMRSFISDNRIDDKETPVCETFAFFPNFCKDIVENNLDKSSEYFVLLEQFILANTILTKFSSTLQQRSDILLHEIKSLRNEMENSQQEAQEKLDLSSFEYETKLEEEKRQRNDAESRLNEVKEILRSNDSSSNVSFKCLSIINGNESNEEDEEEIDTEKYLSKLETKIMTLNEFVESLEEDHEKENKELKEELEKSKEEVSVLEETKEEISKENDQLKEKLENEEKTKKEIQENLLNEIKKNEELQKINEEQEKHLQFYESEKEEEKNQIIDELNAKHEMEINELLSELEKSKAQMQINERNAKHNIKELKKNYKEEIKQCREEVELQTERCSGIKKNYTQILNEMRAKLKDARESELLYKDKFETQSSELETLKSQVSSSVIEQRMLQFKVQSFEERLKREKTLIDSQCQMKILNIETDSQKAIEQEKMNNRVLKHTVSDKFASIIGEWDEKNEDFDSFVEKIVSLIGQQKEIIQNISKDRFDVLKIRGYVQSNFEVDFDNNELYEIVQNLLNENKSFTKQKNEIQNYQKEISKLQRKVQKKEEDCSALREWEDWAKKVYVLITDSFNAGVANSKELRSILEDSLLSNVGSKSMIRKLEILRTEKQIFTTFHSRQLNQSNEEDLKISTVLKCVLCLQRMQKISGHMKYSQMSTPSLEDEFPLPKMSPTNSRKPIIM